VGLDRWRQTGHAIALDADPENGETTSSVECRGDVATKAGARYDNPYCYVCRFDAAGKLVALTEYMDTALAERVLAPPG
jgi:hypothetical protein